jgi:hypothetical protein
MPVGTSGARTRPGIFALLLAPALCGALSAAGGCSGNGEELAPVAGKVTVNGKPLTFGAVSFRPDPSKGNQTRHHPTGEIDAQGNFELYAAGRKGAPPGWYRVLVYADENQKQGATHPLPPRWAVHPKYTDEQTTVRLEVVQKPAPDAYDLKLTR